MLKTNCRFEDQHPLLLSTEQEESDGFLPASYKTAVSRGVLNQLNKWPQHVSAAFVAGSLLFSTFVLFVLVTTMLAKKSDEACRRTSYSDAKGSFNLYFVKHENRTWTPKELCYIETAARDNPELKVYLINLLTHEPNQTEKTIFGFRLFDAGKNKPSALIERNNVLNYSIQSFENLNTTPEWRMRRKLASKIPNLKNINISVEQFFNGLSRVCEHFNREIMEIAARAYVLWNFAGIALDPAMYFNLPTFQDLLCKNNNVTCIPNQVATIELKGKLQASGIPCQAFVGSLIQVIAANDEPDQEYILKNALKEFCPSPQRCSGVRVFNRGSDLPPTQESLHCPTIYPNGFALELNGSAESTLV